MPAPAGAPQLTHRSGLGGGVSKLPAESRTKHFSPKTRTQFPAAARVHTANIPGDSKPRRLHPLQTKRDATKDPQAVAKPCPGSRGSVSIEPPYLRAGHPSGLLPGRTRFHLRAGAWAQPPGALAGCTHHVEMRGVREHLALGKAASVDASHSTGQGPSRRQAAPGPGTLRRG
ncbi:hypothetical protein VULLAG_LOCUS8696 [Vulpes lagopus]